MPQYTIQDYLAKRNNLNQESSEGPSKRSTIISLLYLSKKDEVRLSDENYNPRQPNKTKNNNKNNKIVKKNKGKEVE